MISRQRRIRMSASPRTWPDRFKMVVGRADERRATPFEQGRAEGESFQAKRPAGNTPARVVADEEAVWRAGLVIGNRGGREYTAGGGAAPPREACGAGRRTGGTEAGIELPIGLDAMDRYCARVERVVADHHEAASHSRRAFGGTRRTHGICSIRGAPIRPDRTRGRVPRRL